MATVPDGAYVMISYDSVYLGQQILFTTHYRADLIGFTEGDLSEFYTGIRTEWSALGGHDIQYAGLFVPQVSNIRLVLQVIYPTRYVRSVAASSVPDGSQAAATTVMPPNTAAVITLRSDATGPKELGNKHVLVTNVLDIADGFVQSTLGALLTDLKTLLVQDVAILAGAIPYNLVPVIYHRANPVFSAAITNGAVQPTSRVMRRRTVGQGT